MTAAWPLFSRLIVRPLRTEPVRTLLTVLAVALGVGVVIAIDLAGGAAAGSFHSSLESLTGKGDLLITGTAGVDQRLLGKLAQLPYNLELAPRIEDFASINGKGEALPFIGLDLIALANSPRTRTSQLMSSTALNSNAIRFGSARLSAYARATMCSSL